MERYVQSFSLTLTYFCPHIDRRSIRSDCSHLGLVSYGNRANLVTISQFIVHSDVHKKLGQLWLTSGWFNTCQRSQKLQEHVQICCIAVSLHLLYMCLSAMFVLLTSKMKNIVDLIKVQVKMHLCCIKQGRNIKRTKMLTQTLLHAIAQHSRVQKQGFSDSSKSCGTFATLVFYLLSGKKNFHIF